MKGDKSEEKKKSGETKASEKLRRMSTDSIEPYKNSFDSTDSLIVNEDGSVDFLSEFDNIKYFFVILILFIILILIFCFFRNR